MQERKGECHRCGKCCNAFALGVQTLHMNGHDSDPVTGDCFYLLKATPSAPASCAIWGKGQPAACVRYPSKADHIKVRGCGWYFVGKPVYTRDMLNKGVPQTGEYDYSEAL
jgi:hypothetical protein